MTGYDESDYEHEPRVLIFDIETTPFIGYTWGKWQQNVIDFVENWHLLCFAYRWYGTDEPVKVVSQRQFRKAYKADRTDDLGVTKAMWKLFDEADIVIAHNGNKFDIKKVQARFAIHGMARPSPFQTIDTLNVARKSFNFGSNSLNDLGGFLDLGQKLTHTGFDLWKGCMAGKADSWQKMEDYNVQDVVLLEQVYDRFKAGGWVTTHPDMALIAGKNNGCPVCLSTSRMKRGFQTTTAYRYQRYQCNDCSHYYRDAAGQPGSRSNYRRVS